MDNEIRYEGLLEKESGIFKNKSHVWVVLDTKDLSFYRQQKRSSCIGSIKIVDIQTVRVVENKFTQFEVRTESKSFLFNASDSELANTWVRVIQEAMMNNDFLLRDTIQTNPIDDGQSTKPGSRIHQDNLDFSSSSGQSFFGVKLRSSRKSTPSPVQKNQTFSFTSAMNSNTNTSTSRDTQTKNSINNDCFKAEFTENSELVQCVNIPPSSMGSNLHDVGQAVTGKSSSNSACNNDHDSQTFELSSGTDKVTDENDRGVNCDAKNSEQADNSESIKERRPSYSNADLRNGRNSPECIENANGGPEDTHNQTEIAANNECQPKQIEVETKTFDKDCHTQERADKDVELRTKSDHSDVDISGVEMRRSRRSNRNSNRNNSSNESWSRSIRSRGSVRDDQGTALPEIQIETTDAEDMVDEVFDINEILGPLVKLGINGFDDHTNNVTWQSEACNKLKVYLEENSERPFDLSNHIPILDDSVQKLRSLLCN